MAKPVKDAPQAAQSSSLPPQPPFGDDAEAIWAALGEAGVLALLRAFLDQRQPLSEIVVQKLNTAPTKRAVKNLVTLSMGLGALPEEAGTALISALNLGLQHASQAAAAEDAGKMSIWAVLRLLKDPDIARAIHYLAGFLKGMGKALESSVLSPEE